MCTCPSVGRVNHHSKSTPPFIQYNYQKCCGKTKVSFKNVRCCLNSGNVAAITALLSPRFSWKVKKGLRLVHERIKSLMRLKDKTRKRKSSVPGLEHVGLLNLSVEIGFGDGECFPHRLIIAFSTDQRSSHPCAQSKPQPIAEQKHNVIAAVLDQRSVSVGHITRALHCSGEQSWKYTFICWPAAPHILSSNDSQTLDNLIRDCLDTAVINWKLSSESHIKSQPWGN